MIIGITGGTGCGKTTLLEMIRQHGGLVLDCDRIYHGLLQAGGEMVDRLAQRFPEAMEDGILNRKKLGTIVFSDPAALAELNEITHSAVKAEVLRLLAGKPALAAIDAIGLFEGGLAELCDVTVAVTAPEEARIRRLMVRDSIPESYARARIAAQKKEDWFRQRCDYVLENDGELDAFATKCVAFLRNICIMRT